MKKVTIKFLEDKSVIAERMLEDIPRVGDVIIIETDNKNTYNYEVKYITWLLDEKPMTVYLYVS